MLSHFLGRRLFHALRSGRSGKNSGRTVLRRSSFVRRAEALEHRVLLAAVPGGFEDTVVAGGFYLPTSMTFAPDGRLFVTEKGGNVKVVDDGNVLPTPFLTVPANTYSERGLESILFDPNFEDNGFVYVYYTHASPIFNRLSRFTVSSQDPNVADPASELVMLGDIPATGGLHNGGSMHWGNDGMMYLGIGDALVEASAQDLGSLSGKILRLDITNYPNIVPADNPFVGTPGARPEIYALGLRNPFTSAIQPSTGRLFANDVGAASWEEVNEIQAGMNYGWPNAEGISGNPAYVNPIYAFSHNGGAAAVTGAEFYEANQFPASYFGSYFFSDFISGKIFRMDTAGGNAVTTFATGASRPVDFDVAPDGTMYYLAFSEGAVHRIRYVGDGNRSPSAVAEADVTYGPAPLTVNFTAAASSDPDGDPLTFTWNFGDGSPVVTGMNVSHTYASNGIYNARVTVQDGHGGVAVSAPVKITPGESPPAPTIVAPTVSLLYAGGDTVYFEGSATDVQDGTLPASAFSWTIVWHEEDHTHPFLGPINGVTSGTFEIPHEGETETEVWYRVTLTVKDSIGLTSSTYVDVHPQLTEFTLQTNVPGLQLTLEETTVTSGTTVESVVGIARTFGAPAFQILPNGIYLFDSWSDGGASNHTVNVPAGNPVYTANYTQVTSDFDDFYFIQDLYTKLLGRDPTAEELKDAVGLLAGATTRSQLADSIWNSVEHRQQQVYAMYLNYLDRAPAPGELDVLVASLQSGMSEADAALTLVNSPEYVFRINVNTNDVILDYMYQDILGRHVDPSGQKEYLTKLDNGSMTRTEVAHTLMYSDERWRKVIDEYYQMALGRLADPSGRAYYLGQLRSGAMTERQLAVTLVASDEAIRKGILERVDAQNAAYIDAVYRQLQGRAADNNGLAQYTTELMTGATRAAVVAKIWNSPEHYGRIIDELYRTYFDRDADAAGRAHWVSRMQAGTSEEEVAIIFLNSPEYSDKYGSDDEAYVDGLYRDILGRTADESGRAHWLERLAAGDSREEIAGTFFDSEERLIRAIEAYYVEFLRRSADETGREYYLGRLQSGAMTPWAMAQALIASDEYFSKL